MRPWLLFDQFCRDLRYAARALRNAPGFALGAMCILALGVGANLTAFQIFDSILFHRFNFHDVDSWYSLVRTTKDGERPGHASGAVEMYREQAKSFQWLVSEERTPDIDIDGEPQIRGGMVSPNYFEALGIVPAFGRMLDERDAEPGAPPAAVLAYPYWQTRFGANPRAVGRTVHVNGRPLQIAGVAPFAFDGLSSRNVSIWLPASIRPTLFPGTLPVDRDFSTANEALFGKLKPGVSLAAGEAELTAITRAIAQTQPRMFSPGERVHGRPVQEDMSRAFLSRPPVFIFITMIFLVLLSACANLGNMLLARGIARQREIEIRAALGASRGRLVRQMMAENLLLGLLGAAAGVSFGAIAAKLMWSWLAGPVNLQIFWGWPIIAAGFVLALVSAVMFGLPSALQIAQTKGHKVHLRQSLIGVQVAVSCLLLIASGVLAHNGIADAAVNIAFDYRNMIVVDPQIYTRDVKPAIARQRLDALSAQLQKLPGVDSLTRAIFPPLGGRVQMDNLAGLPPLYRNSVAPGYFHFMSLPVLRGRTFRGEERDAVILSESAARAIWRGEDPLDKVWEYAGAKRTVVGIVKDSGASAVFDADAVETYVPIDDATLAGTALILHAQGDPASIVRLIPAAAKIADVTVQSSLMRATRERRLEAAQKLTTLIGSIGVIATALAAAGMFALVAFTVAQRRKELGIRLAIGAKPRHILRVLLAQNARPTALGIAAGVALAITLSRLVRSFIHLRNHDAVDTAGFAIGLACFAFVAALATILPSLRALRIDLSSTLREE